jgi:tetratricopeptide (TPR) repeat protein
MIVRYHGRNDPEMVRNMLQAALEETPGKLDYVSALASLELADGHAERALEVLDENSEAGSLPAALRLLRARILLALGRIGEAEKDARAAASERRAPGPVGTLARILEAQGKRQEAISYLEEADREQPLDASNRWLLARLHVAEGNLEAARRALEATLDLLPDLYGAQNDLAYVLAESGGDMERALALAMSARAASPDDPAVADTLGWVYYKRGLAESAVGQFRAAIDLVDEQGARGGPRADYHYHHGLALLELGRQDAAVQALDKALEIEPEHGQAKEARAQLAASSGGNS